MARSKTAAGVGILFLVFFCLAGAGGTTTVKEITATVDMTLPQLFFSLSSASILLLPLSVVAMVLAIVAYLGKRKNVGFAFSVISFVTFGLFLFLFAREKMNASFYNALSDALKEAGVKKLKKRDVEEIIVTYTPFAYLALAAAGAAICLGMPRFGDSSERRKIKKELLPYAYIAPQLFFFVIFFVTPSVYGIYAAFTKWDLFNEPVFIGLSNFKTLLFDAGNTYYKQLRNGLGNTFKFVIFSVPLCIIVPLAIAVALQTKARGSKFFQALYYFPSLLSITTVALSWKYMFNTKYGVVPNLFGLKTDWFAPPYSWAVLVIVTIWWCAGGNMVIYQSALASIPKDHYEAAAVDGAGVWQQFVNITIPGMKYPLTYTLVMSVVAQFNIYGQPLMLTGFNNNEANAVLLMYIQENAVKKQVAGMSAAMAVILGLCIMVVSFIQMRVLRSNASE